MAFNPSGKTSEFHYLCEMFLDGTTLRFADEDLSIQQSAATGHFYEGRLPAGGRLVRSLGTFLEAKETVTTFEVNLDNRDGRIEDILTRYTVANREVDIWVGEGVHNDNYSKVFPGVVAHPAGVQWNEQVASFNVIDKRIKSRKTLPEEKFTDTNYPHLEDKSLNQPIPILYGNFSSNQPGPVGVRAYCVNTQTQQFKIAGHRLKSIDKITKNAIRMTVAQTSNICLTDASFNLTGVNYNSTDDIMEVHCAGLATANQTLIEKPLDVVKHIYTAYMGLTGSDLNGTAFNYANTETGTEVVRSVITEEASNELLIGELLQEAAFDMRFVEGQYDPKARNLDQDSNRTSFREEDILVRSGQEEFADFSVSRDPDRIYLNKARAQYNYSNIDARYLSAYTFQLTAAVQQASATVERPMNFNWYYQQSDVEPQVQRHVATFSTEPQQIEMTVTARALMKNLADQVDLTYNVFDDRPMQIRKMDLDLAAMSVRISAWDGLQLGSGRWASSSNVAYSAASYNERASSGYWSNEVGFATSTDLDSLSVSKWF